MASKIYTRTGDKGKTSLIGGTKIPKSHVRIDSYGTVDELNSFIGLLGDQLALASAPPSDSTSPSGTFTASASAPNSATRPAPHSGSSLFGAELALLREIQDRLFTIGASLACDPDKEPKLKIPDLKEEDIQKLEKEIDRMNETLPPMGSFLLPGGIWPFPPPISPVASAAGPKGSVWICRRTGSSSNPSCSNTSIV